MKFWLRQWKCDIVCFQETKLEFLDKRIVRSLWGNPYVDWELLEAVGTARGVLLFGINVLLRNSILSWVGFLYLVFGVGSLMVSLGLVLGFMVLLVMLLDKIFGWN